MRSCRLGGCCLVLSAPLPFPGAARSVEAHYIPFLPAAGFKVHPDGPLLVSRTPGYTTQLHIQSPVQALHNHQQSNLLECCSFVQIPDQVTQERALPGCLKRMLGAAHTFLRHARSWDIKQLHSHPQREACLSACSAPNTGSSVSQNEGHQKIIDFT